MRVSAWLLGASTAVSAINIPPRNAAAPRPPPAAARLARRAHPTDVWVSVDGDGGAATVTPVSTTVSGTPTVLSGAPPEITGTVFTITRFGNVRTTTDTTQPAATATAANGSGAFPRCFKKEGELAPWCSPGKNDTFYTDLTYYVTWDPDFFARGNLTADRVDVKISAFKTNATTFNRIGERVDLSKPIRASRGFFAWHVDDSILDGQPAMNLSLLLLYSATVGGGGIPGVPDLPGPTVLVTHPPAYSQPPTQLPRGPALYIGLPTVLGVVVLCVVGACVWNRKARRIDLGNVMSRSRHGYGIGESRAQRLAKSVRRSMRRGGDGGIGGSGRKDRGIQLVEREMLPPEQVYRDDVPQSPRRGDGDRRDAFGVSAERGTAGDRFQNQVVGGGRNAFRDEMRRQESERH